VLILTKIVEFSGDFRPKWPFLDPFLDPLFHPFCRPAKRVICILLKGQKWPFRCHLARMAKRGQKRGPKNGQNGYFGTLRVYAEDPSRIIDISTNHRLSWMYTLITDFTQNRPFSLKSPKIAPNHPKWPFWVISRPTGRGITPYHTPFAPPAGPKVPNKGIGPSGPIRCNIGPQRGTKRYMNLGAIGTQMATLPLNHSK